MRHNFKRRRGLSRGLFTARMVAAGRPSRMPYPVSRRPEMPTSRAAEPPRAFLDFSVQFPKAAAAWDLLREAGRDGPLDAKTCRLIKLAIAIASHSTGATHSASRKAVAAGVTRDEIYQVVALAASTVGLPAAVAAFTWVEDVIPSSGKRRRSRGPRARAPSKRGARRAKRST